MNDLWWFRYHCDIPDEFVFSHLATLQELAKAVKAGHLTEDQKHRFEHQGGGQAASGDLEQSNNPKPGNTGAAGARGNQSVSNVVVVNQRTPCCPWFTCCY